MRPHTVIIQQKKISTMTADEYFEKHPELKKKFDDEIRNDYWGYWWKNEQINAGSLQVGQSYWRLCSARLI